METSTEYGNFDRIWKVRQNMETSTVYGNFDSVCKHLTVLILNLTSNLIFGVHKFRVKFKIKVTTHC